MALIAMAVHDTEYNKRSEMTRKTIESLLESVDWNKHRMIIVDNNSCEETQCVYTEYTYNFPHDWLLISNIENIGTARAINIAIKQRRPGEHVIKIDNDVVINNCADWVEQLERAVARQPKIGLIGLKRKDCWETTWHENTGNRSTLTMLPHQPGEPWIIVEEVRHVIGTCVLHSSALLDRIGYMYQPGLYGYDDTLMTARAITAGFMTCFLSHIDIDHIDPGGTDYIKWKNREAGQYTAEVSDLMRKYQTGEADIYHDFY